MNNGTRRHLAARGLRHEDRTTRPWLGAEKVRRLRRHLLRLLAAAGTALIAVAASPLVPGIESGAMAQRLVSLSSGKRLATITVSVGKAEDVRLDAGFGDVMVGDADIADVHPMTDKTLSILGKKLGTTRVSLYGEGKKLVGVFDVEVAYDTTLLQDELKRRFPHARLRTVAVNGRIMLTGTAPDGVTLDKAVMIARQFGPEVINSVSVDQPQQVMLEVRFIEAARQAGRELGFQWNVFGNRVLTNIGAQTQASKLPITPAGTNDFKQPGLVTGGKNDTEILRSAVVAAGVLGTATPPFGFLVSSLAAKGMTLEFMINALEERGLARRLAEPNLVALSGDTASFLAGGEYPIPVPGLYGQITIDYKRYGVSLAFTPTVLSGGLINMKIEPEVSQIDPSHQVTVGNGIVVPALTVRRANTTVELRDGQSFVLAGLLQNEGTTVQQQLPWIGDVPVLGALFSSKSYQKNESDLVIIVTPRLVRPSRPGEPVPTPLDNTLPANDVDFFINNKPEIRRTDLRAVEGPPARQFTGHMLELVKGGPHAALR